MEKTKNVLSNLNLFQNYFKKIALAIGAISILALILQLSFHPFESKSTFNILFNTGILVALLLYALSKDKIEDERTLKIRGQAFVGAFVAGIILVIIDPFMNLLWDGEFTVKKTAADAFIFSLMMYFCYIYIFKKQN